MTEILVGVISGLIVVALAWLARRSFLARRLHLIQPKLLDYSGLGGNAATKTIELTVINVGRLSEEEVRIQFAPGFKYHVLASNAPGLGVNSEGILEIDRLSPKQEVSLVVMAEGGDFKKEHILGISSKETTGTIKSSVQEAQATPGQVFAGIVFLFLLLLVGYGFGRLIEATVWPEIRPYFFAEETLDFSVKLEGMSEVGELSKKKRKALQETVRITSVGRRSEKVIVAVQLTGIKGSRLSYTLDTSTPVAELRDDQEFVNFDYIEPDVLVFNGEMKTVNMSDYLPKEVSPQLVLFGVRIEDGNDVLYLKYEISLKTITRKK